MTLTPLRKRLIALAFAVSAGALLTACDDALEPTSNARAEAPIPQKTLALMDKIGTTPSAPIVIRTYKQEAEFEVWKLKSDGQYALLKTYPMCRWSGQLGPKVREGDRQVPEGFYTIAPGQMNPNSHYYLAINVGYPNAYDRALGRTGGDIMVHGICSSAGCFSMTDEQIGEIYAIAREAFRGGQRAIQMQSYPFRMTAENLAKHRLDPNIAFWKELKNGSDHFEVAKTETPVLVCGKHYVFGAHADHDVDASEACPALHRDAQVEADVAAKEASDDAAVATLVAQGVKPIRLVYEDGGQNKVFAGRDDASRPEALVSGPTEVALDNTGKPIPAVVKVASADSNANATPARAPAPPAVAATATTNPPAGSAPSSPFGFVGGVAGGGQSLVKKWFGGGGDSAQAIRVFEPQQPIPTDVPLPPRRSASLDAPGPQASADLVRLASLRADSKAKALDASQASAQ
ncbi:MAG TPA: murein L,D-transpeptidase family protein [Roseiarcus sp.]|jgi:murein L,D-transpeptidase YafK